MVATPDVRSFGVRQLAAAFLPASLLARSRNRASFQLPGGRVFQPASWLLKSGSKLSHSKAAQALLREWGDIRVGSAACFAIVARTCSLGPRLFVVDSGRAGTEKNVCYADWRAFATLCVRMGCASQTTFLPLRRPPAVHGLMNDGNTGGIKRRFVASRHAEPPSRGDRRDLGIGHADGMATAAGTADDFRIGLGGAEIEGNDALAEQGHDLP